MKRYISAILIPCFLLQLLGCYSYQEVTFNELKEYRGDEDVKIKTNNEEIIIRRQDSGNFKMNWWTTDSSVVINSIELIKDNNKVEALNKKSEVMFNEISAVELNARDSQKTLLLTIVGIVLIVGPAIFVTVWSGF